MIDWIIKLHFNQKIYPVKTYFNYFIVLMKYIEARSVALVELFITCNIICDMILVYQDYVMVFHQSERPRPYLRKKKHVLVLV